MHAIGNHIGWAELVPAPLYLLRERRDELVDLKRLCRLSYHLKKTVLEFGMHVKTHRDEVVNHILPKTKF